MGLLIRLLVLGLLGATLIGVVQARPDFLGIAALSETQEYIARMAQRREALSRRAELIQQRSDAKQVIIRELLDDKLTLLQAARRFKDLNETPITCQDNYRLRYPGRSDGEKVCRQVLAWMDLDLAGLPPDQGKALSHRYEQELREHLESHDGVVVLPE